MQTNKESNTHQADQTIRDEYVLYFDGCSKGNPGRAGAGAVIYKNGIELYNEAKLVGEKETNNVAEYTALVMGLTAALNHSAQIKELHVKGDSDLVIKQMKGLYKVKSPNMLGLFAQAKTLATMFTTISFTHVYRQFNKRADELANSVIV